MKFKEYKYLSSQLKKISDISRLARKKGLDNELLHVIYSQKVSRDVMKRFYKVKRRTKKMLHQWRKGQSFVSIAHEYDFPPALIATFILQENHIPRKRVWSMLSNPHNIKDVRLQREIIAANKADGVYSPNGLKRQRDRGRWGENKMRRWLNLHNFPFQTEKELRGKYPKTPDFLLGKPLIWEGSKKKWIESKATFGDPIEIKKHLKKQLKPYVELFGEGLVVYWYGYIEDLRMSFPDGVSITDGTYFLKDEKKQRPPNKSGRNNLF